MVFWFCSTKSTTVYWPDHLTGHGFHHPVSPLSYLAGGAGTPTHWQCAATLHYRGFPHSLADHHGAHMSMRQLPLYISPSHPAPSPLAVLLLHLPLCAPSQPIETIKTPCMGEGGMINASNQHTICTIKIG